MRNKQRNKSRTCVCALACGEVRAWVECVCARVCVRAVSACVCVCERVFARVCMRACVCVCSHHSYQHLIQHHTEAPPVNRLKERASTHTHTHSQSHAHMQPHAVSTFVYPCSVRSISGATQESAGVCLGVLRVRVFVCSVFVFACACVRSVFVCAPMYSALPQNVVVRASLPTSPSLHRPKSVICT